MQPSDIEDAAMFLLHLRTQRGQVRGLPGELMPKTIAHAYDIQDATHRFAGWPIGVLKVGCTSEVAQQFLGIPHPIGGRIPTEGVFESGSTVPKDFLASEPLLECEIAMRVGTDGSVDAVAPAIELVNARYSDTSQGVGHRPDRRQLGGLRCGARSAHRHRHCWRPQRPGDDLTRRQRGDCFWQHAVAHRRPTGIGRLDTRP